MSKPSRLIAAGLLALCSPASAQDVVISEFMAANSRTLADKDREFSDWIELFNPGLAPVSLAGWTLTDREDSPEKWPLPAVDLAPGKFLVVFASAKDRRVAGQELHANFQIFASGEFLGLAAPGGRWVSRYAPAFPPQLQDSSHGLPMAVASRTLLGAGAAARLFVPRTAVLGTNWQKTEFVETDWTDTVLGVGFDRKDPPVLADLITSDVGEAVHRVGSSLYLRIPFNVPEEDLGKLVRLRARYDDGFVVWLNGTEVARRNFGTTTPRFDSRATLARGDGDARLFEEIPLPAAPGLLRAGANLLAVQVMNLNRDDLDLLFLPELETVTVESVALDAPRYFWPATPGWPNGAGYAQVVEDPLFSQNSGAYVDPFPLELLTLTEGAEIRYTTDGSEPTAGSTLYQGPISVSTTFFIKARAFKDGFLPSETVSQSYIFIQRALAGFTSNLPIFIVNTFGKTIGQDPYVPVHMVVIDRGTDGRASIAGDPDFAGPAAFKIRGSSTAGTPKPSWRIEVRDDQGEDRDVRLLGLPPESDWILHAPYSFDLALMRNPYIYELSNQVGRYATRTRFCEVYLTVQNRAVTQADYMGVYNFMENIKQGKDRVDVAELEPEDTAEPGISGGYMFKIDRLDPGDAGFSAAGQTMGFVYPKERETPTHQRTWLRTYLDAFGRALNGTRFTDPVLGYAPYVDEGSWIDHHLLNVLSKNVDALRLSTYIHKDRSGKIGFGPIWDFDRSMESTDGRDDDPRTWNGTGDGTVYFSYPWWGRLFSDPAFMEKYRVRWLELRGGPFANQNLTGLVDSMAAELNEAQARNWTKWGLNSPSGWQNELTKLKNWLVTRANWIDSQYIQPPRLSQSGGPVEAGTRISIASSNGELYFTVNGPDPMAADGTPAPGASIYQDPIVVQQNTRIRARSRVAPKVWSSLVQATYSVELMPLVISEVMFAPAVLPGDTTNASDYEFIEFQNAGDVPLDLTGVRTDRNPLFQFSNGTVTRLEPGEHVVVARNPAAFTARYGAGVKLAGKWEGTASLNNRTQTLSLVGPLDEPLLSFVYQSTWHPATGGSGHSLVIIDPKAPRETWSQGESWRASWEWGGSPGRDDIAPPFQVPGDLNQDRRLTVSDAIGLLRHLFAGAIPLPCSSEESNRKLLDLNKDGAVDASDPVVLLRYLFQAEPPPATGLDCIPVPGCPESCAVSG